MHESIWQLSYIIRNRGNARLLILCVVAAWAEELQRGAIFPWVLSSSVPCLGNLPLHRGYAGGCQALRSRPAHGNQPGAREEPRPQVPDSHPAHSRPVDQPTVPINLYSVPESPLRPTAKAFHWEGSDGLGSAKVSSFIAATIHRLLSRYTTHELVHMWKEMVQEELRHVEGMGKKMMMYLHMKRAHRVYQQ